MLQTVICSLSGLSFSPHRKMTPWPLTAKPRCFAYQSFISCLFADLKKMPPIPRIRPFWLMVVFLSCDSTGTEFCTAMANLLPSRIRRSHDLCGHDRRSSSGFDWRFAAEDARGHERDDKPDGQWLR